MIGAITFHAIDRLQERRKLQHLVRHLNKIRKWNLPENGETSHKGYRYITRDGVLVTVIPPTRQYMRKHLDSRFSEIKNEKTSSIRPD